MARILKKPLKGVTTAMRKALLEVGLITQSDTKNSSPKLLEEMSTRSPEELAHKNNHPPSLLKDGIEEKSHNHEFTNPQDSCSEPFEDANIRSIEIQVVEPHISRSNDIMMHAEISQSLEFGCG